MARFHSILRNEGEYGEDSNYELPKSYPSEVIFGLLQADYFPGLGIHAHTLADQLEAEVSEEALINLGGDTAIRVHKDFIEYLRGLGARDLILFDD